MKLQIIYHTIALKIKYLEYYVLKEGKINEN